MKIGGQIPWNAKPLRSIQDPLSDGKTAYERRFGKPFKGPIIPFGSWVEYYPGLFLGLALYAGGLWKVGISFHRKLMQSFFFGGVYSFWRRSNYF